MFILFLQSYEAVSKWEESKKWQKMTDRLKERVKSKEDEIEKLIKQNDMLKHGLDRFVGFIVSSLHKSFKTFWFLIKVIKTMLD